MGGSDRCGRWAVMSLNRFLSKGDCRSDEVDVEMLG